MSTKEQRAKWQAAYRARKKAKQEKLDIPVVDEQGSPVDTDLTVDVADNASEKPSLKDRFLGKMQPVKKTDSAKKGTRGKKIDQNLITTMAPTLIATFTATYSRQLLRDPYKACAPSQKEVLSMIGPFFNILSRYIEITGHASENVIDVITAIIASLMYGTRAYVTYVQIREYEEKMQHARSNGTHGNATTRGYATLGGSPDTTTNERNSTPDIGLVRDPVKPDPNAGNGDTNASDGDNPSPRAEADRVASLFARDRQGRVKLGLLTG